MIRARDLGSTQGTYCHRNGKASRVTDEPVSRTDTLQFGDVRMTVEELARLIGYAASTVRHRKTEYDAQHGTSLRRRGPKQA